MNLSAIWIITVTTLREAKRRRIMFAALVFGGLVLALFATGYFFIALETKKHNASMIERRMILTIFLTIGIYAANALTVMTAAFLPIDTLSGEIASGVLQPVVARPVRRSEIVIGKWFGHWIVIAGYYALLMTGMLVIGRTIGGITPLHLERAMPLMLLEASVFLTLSIAGGTRFSTIANGVMVFGLYGFAFLGSWIEQISTYAGANAARDIGTAASLLIPTEALWQLAAYHMNPPILRDLPVSPFSPTSVPSAAFVVWAVVYMTIVFAFALRTFSRREL